MCGGSRAPVAQKRKRNAGQRRATEVAGDRDRDLGGEQRGQRPRHQRGIGSGRQPCRCDQPPDQDHDGQQGKAAGDQPPLLDEAGKGKVGLASRQVLGQELVDGRRHDPVKATGGDRHVGLEGRPAGALVVVSAVQERVQARQLVGTHEAESEWPAGQGHDAGGRHQLEGHAREKKGREQDHAQQDRRAQVRLHQCQADRDGGQR